jgi:hypothetical protein
MQTTTTRRAILAGLAAAPVAGLPAVAEARGALALAIANHRAAVSAYVEAVAVTSEDDVLIPLMDEMWDDLEVVMRAPCHGEAEFAEKSKYVLAQMERFYGVVPGKDNEHDWVVVVMLRQRLDEIEAEARS